MSRTDIAVIGAGKIGVTIAELLVHSGDYRVTVIDRDRAQLDRIAPATGILTAAVDIEAAAESLDRLLLGKFAVLSAAPFHLTTRIAESARRVGVNYLDLTEDVASADHVQQLAQGAVTAFIPQCGLAPGFVSIVAHDMVQRFDTLDSIRLRVGALPRFPANALKYSLTWSTDGVINEYCEPCEAIVGGVRRQVPPLEDLEELTLDGTAYEAFNTSGGLGTLCDTYLGRVRELNYRTVRYPGHAAIMKTLLGDLRLRERRHVLKDILEHALPSTTQDVVVISVTVAGRRAGRLVQETYANTIYGGEIDGQVRSAIQITTATSICAVLDLLVAGRIPGQGFVRQEDIDLDAFLSNRFGRPYVIQADRHDPVHSPAPEVFQTIHETGRTAA
ncbi:saccharopine dehydrogenase family protein [Reyranella sp. CPCC 100927]|uniref:saccharopine dehydrogenase family protein n=1 Tax=Reyranella sp. CPCC 100927 TaxID=2599616 RepID=UPI0011B718A1|nr:saccharopine dehydrogenase family protein [Reyranella sp. CPCC 100927]TWT12566.1 saccharopine dehydrogenase family protein [Reyranella sp. CPCC 100927]